MFISIPRDYFVPVLFSDEFRYNSEDNSMEYDTEDKNSREVINRRKLQDLEYTREDGGFTAEYMENLININDKKIEEQILNYSKSLIKFLEELKKSNCLGNNEASTKNLINYYAKGFRNIYDNYKNLIANIRMPISSADEEGIIDKYIGELEDLYNKNLAELNCKDLNFNIIEETIDEIFDNAREILKEEIANINCGIINRKTSCKKTEEINKSFSNGEKIYEKIDNEFVREMEKSM